MSTPRDGEPHGDGPREHQRDTASQCGASDAAGGTSSMRQQNGDLPPPVRACFRWSVAAYRLLIRAYPPPFRDRFAEAMAADFVALCDAETTTRGAAWGRVEAWRCAIADVMASVPRERRLAHARGLRIVREVTHARALRTGGDAVVHDAGSRRIDMITQETRFALRRLRRTPGFTLAAILTLGLGIGGTTTVYSVLQAVVLRPLPFPEPARLMRLYEVTPQGDDFSTSEPNFLDFRARMRTLDDLAAFANASMTLLGRGDARRLRLASASHTFFPLTGARTIVGRPFGEDEDRAGGNTRVIVLAHGLWQRQFGGDPQIVGQRISLDGHPYEVVGVMAREFDFPANVDGWVPLAAHGRAPRGNHLLRTIGRLKSGVSIADAQTDARAVAATLSAEYPQSNGGWSARLDTLEAWLIGTQVQRTLYVLLGAAALLLAVASVNVANLLTIRATARRKELAMLAALGAARGRIAGSLLIESLMLALAGGALGVVLAYLGVPVLQRLAPANVPRLDEAAVDATVLAVAIAVSAFVGLAFGMMPALLQTRSKPQDWLRDSTGGASAGPGRRRLREVLVASELALAMTLLVGAALLVDSFRRLQTVDLGFDVTNVLAVDISLTSGPYAQCIPGRDPGCDRAAVARRRGVFLQEAEQRVASLPGVASVGVTNISPLGGGGTAQEMTVDGYVPRGPEDVAFADWRAVSSGFFAAMTLPIVRGRTFTDAENVAGRVAIVSETFARRYWPNQDPVGRQVATGRNSTGWLTVVGVARDMRDILRDRDPQPVVFLPSGLVGWASMTLLVKTHGSVDGVAAAIRRDLIAIDKTIPVPSPYPLTRNTDRSMSAPRFSTLLMGLFAGVALALAALGVYGVTAYAVALRTREIGVRMALGAEPGQMVRLIAGRGLVLAVAGILAGSFGAFLLSGFLESLLFGTRPVDPRSHLIVAAVLLVVALVAIVIPARRASRIDPRQALTAE